VIEGATARLRFLLFELHPPSLDTAGLASALQGFMRLGSPEGDYWFDVQDTIDEPPDQGTQLTLYRIAQEALNNARKHANAREIKVELSQRDEGYVVRVADNGKGFDLDHSRTELEGMGLLSLKERAEMAGGWCTFESRPDAGTIVEAWLPANRDEEA
jgi:signal transduction histidine kinase